MSIQVRMVYHFEDGSWWADSEDAPGYYAGAATLGQLRERVHEGLEFHFEDSVEVTDEIIEIVSTTHPREDVTVEQRVCHLASQLIIVGSTELTTAVSKLINVVPPLPATVSRSQPNAAHKGAMAGY